MANTDPYITVAPSTLRLDVGESKQIQVFSSSTEFDIVVHNKDQVYFDAKHLEIKGLAVGNAQVDLIIGKGTADAKTASVVVVVEAPTEGNNIKYMFHNRGTNRLVTIISDKTLEEHLTFFLPGKDGTLCLEDDLEGKLNLTPTP